MIEYMATRRMDEKSSSVTATLWGLLYLNFFIVIPTVWNLRYNSFGTEYERFYTIVYFLLWACSYHQIMFNKYVRCWAALIGGILPLFMMNGPSYLMLLPFFLFAVTYGSFYLISISTFVQIVFAIGAFKQTSFSSVSPLWFLVGMVAACAGPVMFIRGFQARRMLPPGVGVAWLVMAILLTIGFFYPDDKLRLTFPSFILSLLPGLSKPFLTVSELRLFTLYAIGIMGVNHCRQDYLRVTAYMRMKFDKPAQKEGEEARGITWGNNKVKHFSKFS